MTRHCWLCDTEVVLDPDGTCPDCGEVWRDPADGPTERQIEWAMNRMPPEEFLFVDQDHLGRGGMR